MVGPVDADGDDAHVSQRAADHRAVPASTTRCAPTLVIDRLAHWYYHPREWLKKAALVNGTYLLNSPFTFQSMEKHSAYCAMVRLGLKVPADDPGAVQEPGRQRPLGLHLASATTAPFDLDEIAEDLGFPLYMKPFDGGGWRGVSRINDPRDLHRAYDESGEMLMHLQATSTTSTSPGRSPSGRRPW